MLHLSKLAPKAGFFTFRFCRVLFLKLAEKKSKKGCGNGRGERSAHACDASNPANHAKNKKKSGLNRSFSFFDYHHWASLKSRIGVNPKKWRNKRGAQLTPTRPYLDAKSRSSAFVKPLIRITGEVKLSPSASFSCGPQYQPSVGGAFVCTYAETTGV